MITTENPGIFERVDLALNEIRPHLQVDGGDIVLVEVTEDLVARIKWVGNCEHCSMSAMTMRAGVEQAIKSRLPEIRAVEALNGYFAE
ncbi:MAG: NifU family protein [Saprospiraceae bacterium]|jgi:Fe-S cluster biogenesis protein NfuA|nr:NifU family protein [Saprospiraceae bacterium]MBP6236094.1 NifU family protein [Saprospiraceae bacterium]MBP6568194.1 NifU family protein [Saprospiraceae bacterium]